MAEKWILSVLLIHLLSIVHFFVVVFQSYRQARFTRNENTDFFYLQTPVFTFWAMGTKASKFFNERSAALLISDWQWCPFTNYWLLADSAAYGRFSAVLAIPCWADAVSWHYPSGHVVWAEANRGALANSGYFSSKQQPRAVDLRHEWSGRHDDVYVWWDWHALRCFQWSTE